MVNKQERILIVDDEVTIRRLLRQKLSKEGYQCEEADSAEQALDKLRSNSIEMVIPDIKMPGKSGTDLLPEIQASYPDTAVIMATAVTDINIAIQCMKQGADDYITKKILIADDEASVRLLVKKLLSKNYIVLEANDGKEAVTMAYSEKPDLILMDIMMPKMDGNTACYALKMNQDTKAIPVVMFTAIGYELNKKLSQDVMGADGYITKPFSRQDLLDTISQFLKGPDKT